MSKGIEEELAIFRTTWLRAVAFAWSNKEFKQELLHPPRGEDALDVIARAFPHVKESRIGEAITLSVHNATGFVWIGNDWSWVPGPDLPSPTSRRPGEGLTLRVPLVPPVDDARQCAAALADYYALRPSLFSSVGRSRDAHSPPPAESTLEDRPRSSAVSRTSEPAPSGARRAGHVNSPVLALARSLAPMFSGQRVFSDLTPQNGHLMFGAVRFREFEIALTVMMARAWDNHEFRTLIQMPGVFREALQYAHGYAPPWQLRTDIVHDDQAEWSPRSRWTNVRRHELTLSLPQPPGRGDPRSHGDWPVALAAYNATGAQYPFSCCGTEECLCEDDSCARDPDRG